MSIMNELNQGTTLNDIITSLSQDRTSTEAEKSWALKRGVEFCQAFEGQDALLNLHHHLKAIKDFAIANNLEFDYIPEIRLIPPEDTLQQFLVAEREQEMNQTSNSSSYVQELAKYINNRLTEDRLYIGQIDLSNAQIIASNSEMRRVPIEPKDIQPGMMLQITDVNDMKWADPENHQLRTYLCMAEQVSFSEQTGLVLDTGFEILFESPDIVDALNQINPQWERKTMSEPTNGFTTPDQQLAMQEQNDQAQEQNCDAQDPTDIF